jgi:hypothetical protein
VPQYSFEFLRFYQIVVASGNEITDSKIARVNAALGPGSLSEVEGTVKLTSLYELVCISSFYSKKIFAFFTTQAVLTWRSTVLSLSRQLAFPVWVF